METKIKVLHDDYGHTATICERMALMHKWDVERRKVYILSLTADYDNDFMYFKSEFRSMDALNAKLKTTRVKWKEDKGN